MAQTLGNKFYATENVPPNAETVLFSFTFQGSNVGFYFPTGVQVYSPTGCLDFILRVYYNGQQIGGKRTSVTAEDCYIDLEGIDVGQMVNGSTLMATVYQFDTQTPTHDFESTLEGNGSP